MRTSVAGPCRPPRRRSWWRWPNPLDELTALLRLRRLIEPCLLTHAATRHNSIDLDRIERTIAACTDPSLHPDRHYELHHEVHIQLLRPPTSWEETLLATLLRATSRYLRVGPHPAVIPPHQRYRDHLTGHYELLAAFRAGDTERAHIALLRHLDLIEQAP